jgi:oligopeptide/dipeptide ABC transporter ATP-binding protein
MTFTEQQGFREDGPLLEVSDLHTHFFAGPRVLKAVDGVSFHISAGEVFGLVGESGSGKTLTALSILRLVPSPGRVVSGEIRFEGRNILELSQKEVESTRGGRIGMVFQEPMTALNPVLRIGDQIGETLAVHGDLQKRDLAARVTELLEMVGFRDPEKRVSQYPHQLSGGQRQRVLIAMAISCDPSLVIADEPTTALDVVTEAQILYMLKEIVTRKKASLLFITHNLHTMKRMGDRIGIMYAGRLLELSNVAEFFHEPLHPYSKGLLASVYGFQSNEKRLKAIPGYVPKLTEMPAGCKFSPRCPFVMDLCKEREPAMTKEGGGRWVRCFLYQT